MREYRIKITGEYDVIVLSPKMIALLINKIRNAGTKEMVIPAKEILPQGYAEYLTRALDANAQLAETLPNRNAYSLIAEQMRKMQFDEKECFDRVEVTEPESNPQLDMEASKDFFIVTKQENSRSAMCLKMSAERKSALCWSIYSGRTL